MNRRDHGPAKRRTPIGMSQNRGSDVGKQGHREPLEGLSDHSIRPNQLEGQYGQRNGNYQHDSRHRNEELDRGSDSAEISTSVDRVNDKQREYGGVDDGWWVIAVELLGQSL